MNHMINRPTFKVTSWCIMSLLWITMQSGQAEGTKLTFDREALHTLAVEESLKPIRPGVPDQQLFWNHRASSFIYAPSFDFKPVQGAKSYRFTITCYGPKSWTFEDPSPQASLESIWKELRVGKFRAKLLYFKNNQGRWTAPRQKLFLSEKKSDSNIGALDFKKEEAAVSYRFLVEGIQTISFEADQPWASLAPVWKELVPGPSSLVVEGLDKKGGEVVGLSKVNKRKSRSFEKRVAFAGPYHETAIDYIEAGSRWLRWQSKNHYRKWKKEGDPKKLGKYPCKEEVSAIEGLTALATLEPDSKKKEELIQMARNAARTLIKGSFSNDWGLAGLAPTYGGKKYGLVMMNFPSFAGDAYLDLYKLTQEKEFLTAAISIADTYKRLQLADGSWSLLMDAKSGKKASNNKTSIMPTRPMMFLNRLIDDHDLKTYQPIVDLAWKWIERDVLPQFRFEGQFEDTVGAKGGARWHVSHRSAHEISAYLLKYLKDKPGSLDLAEQITLWTEDQFLFWESPGTFKKVRFTPRDVEQHNGPLLFSNPGYSTGMRDFISGFRELYEATGKEIYLAKSVTLANAMTVLQKRKYGGNYVSTDWGWGTAGGSWVNCHTWSARGLIQLGQLLKEKGIKVDVNPDATLEGLKR